MRKLYFCNLGPMGPWTQNLAPGSKLPQIWMLGFSWVCRQPYCGVLWENCKFLNLGPKRPLEQNCGPRVQITLNWLLGSRGVHRHPYNGTSWKYSRDRGKNGNKKLTLVFFLFSSFFFDLRQLLTCRFAAGKNCYHFKQYGWLSYLNAFKSSKLYFISETMIVPAM